MTTSSVAQSDLLHEGIAALSRGWAVTPMRGKRPFLSIWQAAPMPSASEVRLWVGDACNLGVRTGPVSGAVVIDHDPRNDDGTPLPALPRTVTARTGGGGSHHYFACPIDPPPNSSGRLHPALDVKSTNGVVVLAGSVHPDTRKVYRWAPGLGPDDVAITEIPAELLLAMRAPKTAPPPRRPPSDLPAHDARLRRARGWLAKVPGAVSGEGGHNRTFHVACTLAVGFDLGKDGALSLMFDWNQSCMPPWSEKDLVHKITDAMKQGDEPGYMLVDSLCVAPTSWAVAALTGAAPKHITLPTRVSSKTISLLNSGRDTRYERDGAIEGSRAVFAAAMSLLAAGLSDAQVAATLAASALRPVIDRQGENNAAWLTRKVVDARKALERPRRRPR